jgi:hypothetical protein
MFPASFDGGVGNKPDLDRQWSKGVRTEKTGERRTHRVTITRHHEIDHEDEDDLGGGCDRTHGALPGASCLATIVQSLRDKNHSPIEAPSHYLFRRLFAKNEI